MKIPQNSLMITKIT